MLARPGLATTSSSLRHRLRRIVFQTRIPCERPWTSSRDPGCARGFTATAARLTDNDGNGDEVFLPSNKVDVRRRARHRLAYPLGRVVGRPGRRQRESAETLTIPSMRQPFEVVLMQDISEPKPKEHSAPLQSSTTPALSPAQITSKEAPTQEEINDSIEALRPETNIVDQQTSDSLVEQLTKSYSKRQLSLYLTEHTRVDSANSVGKSNHIRKSVWLAGETSLQERRPLKQKSPEPSTKAKRTKCAREILRLAWGVTITSLEQQIGELEMYLRPWQLRYLFSSSTEKGARYEGIIRSPLLLRAAKIEPYHQDNVARITARRQDAETIVALIEARLSSVVSMELDLDVFKPLLGTLGWPASLDQLVMQSDIENAEQYSNCIIEWIDGRRLRIYGEDDAEKQHARRLLLSLLPLAFQTTVKRMEPRRRLHDSGRKAQRHIVPNIPGDTTNMPFALRDKRLYRSAAPAPKASAAEGGSRLPLSFDKELCTLAEQLDNDFQALESNNEAAAVSGDLAQGYWDSHATKNSQDLAVQLCQLLHPLDNTRNGKPISGSSKQLVQPQIPGANTLLSYFKPKQQGFAFDDTSLPSPSLTAHFYPSPLTKQGVTSLQNLPRIKLRYKFADRPEGNRSVGARRLYLSGMTATYQRHELRVPLPGETSDLRVLRQLNINATRAMLEQDQEISSFTNTLRRSVASGNGALVGKPSIKTKLPSKFVSSDDAGVEYLFERFEQVQTVDLVPLNSNELPASIHPAMREALMGMPASAYLQHTESQGGIIGGSGKALSVKMGPMNGSIGSRGRITVMIEASLRLVQCLTRINAGDIPPLEVPQSGTENSR